jgi:hypothetical protein
MSESNEGPTTDEDVVYVEVPKDAPPEAITIRPEQDENGS